MKKLALFVEGHTEVAFARRLVPALAGSKNVIMIGEEQHGGIFSQSFVVGNGSPDYLVLIANCCNDSSVVSFIRDRYQNLVNAEYDLIIGLRDLYPLSFSEFDDLQDGIGNSTPIGDVPVNVIIAVAEVEAWFIEEVSHFARIDARLDEENIKHATGYSIKTRMAEKIPHPAALLNAAYQIAGMAWKKRAPQVARTINSLDMVLLEKDSTKYSVSLNNIVVAISEFFK